MSREAISLNGTWEIRFDSGNIGAREGWAVKEWPETRTIDVPSTWNIIEPEYEGVAFYRRKFMVSGEHRGRKIRLRFAAVNYAAEVWINGVRIGEHEGGYTPFEFDIGDAVLFDTENDLTVRVVDPPNDGSGRAVDGLRHMEIPSGKESWYVNFSGVWQEVELLITGHTYVDDVHIVPDIKRGTIQARMTIQSESNQDGLLSFTITTLDGETELARQIRPVSLDKGLDLVSLDIPVPNSQYWEPENPALYLLTAGFSTRDGFSDSITVRFGMRALEVRNNFFFLNGKRIILRGVLHQQQYPKNLACPESKEEARRIVRLLKEGGWNLIRMHIRPTTPEFLDVCDEEGMLVFEEPAIGWIVESDKLRERAITEVRDMVRRDRNHPSIVMWGILNESGVRGAPDVLGRTKMYWDQGEMGIQKYKPELARIIRDEDSSRIITDDSGAVTCNYYLPDSYQPVSYYDNHLYMSYPLSHAGFEVFRNLGRPEDFFRSYQFEGFPLNYRIAGGSPEKLFFQSEFGCGGLPLWPEVLAAYEDGSGVTYRDEAVYRRIDHLLREHYDSELADVFPSYEDMLRETQRIQAVSARRMIEALRANSLCAGYVFTQLHDNDYECNAGLLDPLFRPKLAYSSAQEANRPMRVVLETHERTVYPGGEYAATIYLVNDAGFAGTMEMNLTVSSPDGSVMRDEWLRLPAREGVQEASTIVVRGLAEEGAYITRVALLTGSQEIDSAFQVNQVISPRTYGIEPRQFALVPFEGKVSAHLTRIGVNPRVIVRATDGTIPGSDFYVIEPINDEDDLEDTRLPGILDQVRQGADALFLGLPLVCLSDADEKLQELRDQGKYVCWCSPADLETDLFGFPVEYFDSKPRFAGPYHYFRPHPVFEGMDPGHVLDERFANIMPLTSLRIKGAKTLGGAFGTPAGYHFKIRGCERALDLRAGADLCVVPYGKGRLI
ncbi:MAG: glycoside hydrolase family 2 protein, partial [Candidatus Latescibacterota bacterium]